MQKVIAFVSLPAKDAYTFMKAKSLKIGPFRRIIRQCEPARKCYRCTAVPRYGHTSLNCSWPDRTDFCYKYTQKGYKAKDCKNEEKCLACIYEWELEEQTKHLLGTGSYTTYRITWRKAKKKTQKSRQSQTRTVTREEIGWVMDKLQKATVWVPDIVS